MSAYRVIAPMVSPAAFAETMKTTQPMNYYRGDIVTGADQRDLDRLVAEGYLEVVEIVPAPTRYRVKGDAAVVRVPNLPGRANEGAWRNEHLYQNSLVPLGVAQADLERLVEAGLIEPIGVLSGAEA